MTYETKLTKANWQIKDVKIVPPDTSIFFFIDTCVRDNYTRYFMDGTYTDFEAGIKCDLTEPVEQRGTWRFSGDKKFMYTTDFEGIQTTYSILLLDNENFQLQYTDTNARVYKLYYRLMH